MPQNFWAQLALAFISFNSITFQPVSEKPDPGFCPIKAGTLPASSDLDGTHTELYRSKEEFQ